MDSIKNPFSGVHPLSPGVEIRKPEQAETDPLAGARNPRKNFGIGMLRNLFCGVERDPASPIHEIQPRKNPDIAVAQVRVYGEKLKIDPKLGAIELEFFEKSPSGNYLTKGEGDLVMRKLAARGISSGGDVEQLIAEATALAVALENHKITEIDKHFLFPVLLDDHSHVFQVFYHDDRTRNLALTPQVRLGHYADSHDVICQRADDGRQRRAGAKIKVSPLGDQGAMWVASDAPKAAKIEDLFNALSDCGVTHEGVTPERAIALLRVSLKLPSPDDVEQIKGLLDHLYSTAAFSRKKLERLRNLLPACGLKDPSSIALRKQKRRNFLLRRALED